MRLLPLLLCVAFTGACGDSSPDGSDTGSHGEDTDSAEDVPACTQGGVVLDIGTGANTYQPLGDGDVIFMVYGPQGGWHVDVGGRISGSTDAVTVDPSVVWVAEDIQLAGLAQETPTQLLAGYDTATCTGSFAGVQAFLKDYFPDSSSQLAKEQFICGLAGESLRIDVTVTDLNTGAATTASRTVTAMPDPATNNCP